jgi:hypothetical protein
MSKVRDYRAATCFETLLHLLEQQGYKHFRAFGSRCFEFPTPKEMPAPSKTVDQITKIILRNFWAKAVDRLTKVESFDLYLRLKLFLCIPYSDV